MSEPRRPRRWRKRLAILLGVLLLLVVLAPLALALPFVRNEVASRIGEALGREVTIDGASAFWGKGIDLRGITIASGPGFEAPLATIDRVHVDVDVLGALGGAVRARVLVEQPVVTVLVDGGRTNLEAAPKEPSEPRDVGDDESRGGLDLDLEVVRGRIVAPGDPDPQEIDGLQLRVRLVPSGAVTADLGATARRAGPDGGDVPVSLSASLDAEGRGPVRAVVPTLDLARLQRLAAAMGLRDLAGRIELGLEGTLEPGPLLAGTARIQGSGLRAVLSNAAVVELMAVSVDGRFGDGGAGRFDLQSRIDGLTVVDAEGGRFTEKTITAALSGTHEPSEDALTLTSGSLDAGAAAHAEVREPVSWRAGELTGSAEGVIDLSNLRGLRPIVPALEGVDGGVVRLELRPAADGALSVAATVTDLTLGPPLVGGRGHHEPEARAHLLVAGNPAGGRTVVLDRLETSFASLDERVGPVRLVLPEDGAPGVSGPFTLVVRLDRVSSAFGPSLGLEGDDRFGGTLRLQTTGELTGEAGELFLSLQGDAVALPRSWTMGGRGYRDDTVRMDLRYRREAGKDDRVLIPGIRTTLLAVGEPGASPLEIVLTDAGPALDGPVVVTVGLRNVGRALGGRLGLTPADPLDGTLRLDATTRFSGDDGSVDGTLAGDGIVLPASWAGGRPQRGTLAGALRARLDEGHIEMSLEGLRGFGLEASASARATRGDEGGLETARLDLAADLAAAQGLLAPLLGLEAGTRLAGQLTSEASFTPVDGGGSKVDGTTRVTSLRWQDPAGTVVLDEPELVLLHTAVLANGGWSSLDNVRLTSSALTAKLGGRFRSVGEDTELDATLDLEGRVPRLAAILKGMLGEDGKSLEGSGELSGSFRVQGSTADRGRALLVNGTLTSGNWKGGGLTVTGGTLTLSRPDESVPLTSALVAAVNGGTVDLAFDATPGARAVPWSTRVKVAGVDTSPLVVDHGPAQYLVFLFPTFLPPGADQPVLSGRLDAELSLAADDLESPAREDTLRGQGVIKMERGSMASSTLFGAIQGGSGLGQVGQVLVRAVPAVGEAFAGFSKVVTFHTAQSSFTVSQKLLRIRRGVLSSDRTQITFQGNVDFDQRIDLQMWIAMSGTAGEQLAKVLPSKTIPLGVRGTLEKPAVTPGIKTEDLARAGLGDLLGGGDPVDRLRDLLGR